MAFSRMTSGTGDAMKFLGPKDVAARIFLVVFGIWSVAIAAQLAVNALAKVWPLVIVAVVGAAVWFILVRRR
jgi:uncharacterized protein (DUF983 family)